MLKTIVAISTGNINQPISLIRMSGDESLKIIQKIFVGKIKDSNSISYGKIYDNKTLVDEVLISWFKAPNSFTGEDIIEINAHGGVINTQRILNLLLDNGAKLALPGEFSRRAFMNGKINLVKAEAIHDLIFAKTLAQAQLSVNKFDNTTTTNLIKELLKNIEFLISICETNIDYPEYEDVEILTAKTLIPKLNDINMQLKDIQKYSTKAKYIYEGINVAIVGQPNFGKSSLFNFLLNQEKAIVTNQPGTTRDILDGEIKVGQVLLKLHDTAGIRSTNKTIEKIGISKTINEIQKSNLVIHLVSCKNKWNSDDEKIKNIVNKNTYIQIHSKIDLCNCKKGISIKDKNISLLLELIKSKYSNINLSNEKILNNVRQLSLINRAKQNLEDAIQSLSNGLTPDIVIVDIRNAWENIANIIGQATQEDLLTNMFSNFCLGK